MEEVRRVTTTRKSNKLVTALLIIAGILGLILIAVAIYFYRMKSFTETQTTTTKTCACYYIDPAITSECGDPRRGFLFKTSTVEESANCPSSCTTSSLSVNLLNSTTKQEAYLSCPITNIQDTRCTEMTVKDSSGKIITGRISGDEKITVEAKFDREYKDYQILLNNEPSEPENISSDKLTIKKTLSGFTTPSLNIVATGKDNTGEQINSPLCKRVIEVTQSGTSNVSALQLTTRLDNNVYKISKAVVKVANLESAEKLAIKFSFSDPKFTTLQITKGFTFDKAKGEITILEQDLYKDENFTGAKSFAQLNGYVGKLKVTADITVADKSIGLASSTIDFPQVATTPTTPTTETPTAPTESNFKVTVTNNVTCLERVSPNNVVQYSITINNQATTTQNITSIKDKLPLGFSYIANSSRINSVSVRDTEYVKVTTVGQTKEIVWTNNKGWAISAGQSLTIIFQAQADANALTGTNQNEVVIEPAQIPSDPTSVRAESVVTVTQSCTSPTAPTPAVPSTPETGLFDSIIGRVILGIGTLILGWFIYNKPFGQVVAKKFVSSEVYKEAEMTSWRIFKPRKYFEEKTIKRFRKK